VFTTILIIIIAYLVPDITSFLGLVGSMVSTILGFINPVLMYQV
jgi:hypothetical protein